MCRDRVKLDTFAQEISDFRGEYLFPRGSTYFLGYKYWGSTYFLGNKYWGVLIVREYFWAATPALMKPVEKEAGDIKADKVNK